jgi:hypothetical protein
MRWILNIRMLSVRAALLAMLAAGLVLPAAQAQSAKQNQQADKQASGSSQAQAPSARSTAGEAESAPAHKEHAGGPQEGIKVHGHWVIDVRNPDGTLVTHREFENAYSGSNVLSAFLYRHFSPGYWIVGLNGVSKNYSVTEPPYTSFVADSYNLIVFPDQHDSGFYLSGSFTPSTSDTIGAVNTSVEICPGTVPPFTACQNGSDVPFTGTTLSPGISFVGGQIVQVTVTINFS